MSVIHHEGFASVIPSVAMMPMAKRGDQGYGIRFGVFVRLGELVRTLLKRTWRAQKEVFKRIFHGPIDILILLLTRLLAYWPGRWSLSRWAGRHAADSNCSILHCRGDVATMLALDVKGSLQGGLDMRGFAHA